MAIQNIMGGSGRLPRQREWEEPQRKKAVQGFKLPFREIGQAAEALGTAARSGARTAQALEGKAQDTNRFTVVNAAAPKEADSPAALPAAERENGFRLPGVEKGVTELARQTGDIARRGKETAAQPFPQAPAERDALLRQTRQTVQGAARGVQNAAKAAASLKLPGTGSAEQREPTPEEARAEAELLQLLADQTVQELEQELKAYRENVRIPLRAGSGYAAAELDIDSEEYRRGKALEQRLEYARIRQKKVGDLVVFTTDMAKIAAMTEEQRQDLRAVAQMKELWRGIVPNADNWNNPYVVNGQEEGHAAMQRLLEAGYSAQDVQDMAVTYQRSQNQAFMGQVRRTAREMVDDGFLSAAGANLLTLPLQFLAGTAGTVDTAVNYVQYKLDPSARRYSGLDPNLPWYAPSEFTGTVRQETRENIVGQGGPGNELLGHLYGGAASAVDNLLRLYSSGGSQAVSLGLMGLNSFQDTARDVSARGGSPEQAIILGAISAGSEILTEKYSLEKLMDVLKIAGEAAPEMPRKLLRSILAQGGYEVAEEEMNLVINVFSDTLVMGGNSEFNNQVAYWMESEGCTEAEAKNRAWEGLLRQAADTAIESFLSGEMMSGMGTAVEVAKEGSRQWKYHRAVKALDQVMGWDKAQKARQQTGAAANPGIGTAGSSNAHAQTSQSGNSGIQRAGNPDAGAQVGQNQNAGMPAAGNLNAGGQMDASADPQAGQGTRTNWQNTKEFLAKRAAIMKEMLLEEAAYQRYSHNVRVAALLFDTKAENFTPEVTRAMFEGTQEGQEWKKILRAQGYPAPADGRFQLPVMVQDGFLKWQRDGNMQTLPWLEEELALWRKGSKRSRKDTDLMAKLPVRTVEKFDPARYNNIINELAVLDSRAVYQKAASGEKHGGTYRDGIGYKKSSLESSIHHRTEQVLEHMLKVENPTEMKEWAGKSIREQRGYIVKWIKDMVRNAEQALIEIEIWRDRYEHRDDEN